jgi:dTDP-4-dehydrorhamnose reductase
VRALVTGATGYLGRCLVAELERRGIEVVGIGRWLRLGELARESRAELVVHAGAVSSMAACAADEELAMAVNGRAVGELAGIEGLRVVYVSTDLVFDGVGAPYLATAEPRPLSAYGRSKRAGELEALGAAGALVVRLPLLFGRSFDGLRGATDMLRSGKALALYTNEHRTPLHVADAAAGLSELAVDRDRTGVVHLAGPERVSRFELAERFVRASGFVPVPGSWWPAVATARDRPRDTSLLTDVPARRSLDEALAAS